MREQDGEGRKGKNVGVVMQNVKRNLMELQNIEDHSHQWGHHW